jgi:hypothetical protein
MMQRRADVRNHDIITSISITPQSVCLNLKPPSSPANARCQRCILRDPKCTSKGIVLIREEFPQFKSCHTASIAVSHIISSCRHIVMQALPSTSWRSSIINHFSLDDPLVTESRVTLSSALTSFIIFFLICPTFHPLPLPLDLANMVFSFLANPLRKFNQFEDIFLGDC